MKTILYEGKEVLKKSYVEAKTKALIQFGYSKLTEEEVSEQVEKILKGDKDLTVIGQFCTSEIEPI